MLVFMGETIWGIHGGRSGDAGTLFLKSNVVAIGWAKLGDLSKLGSTRDAFKQAVAKAWPEKKAGAVPNNAGQLFRFVYEIKPGDIVVFPSKWDRTIHVGRVEGPYRYDPGPMEAYPNLRSVKWLKHVPRSSLSQGALYELGSALSLFQVKNYGDEILALLEIKSEPRPVPPKQDETVAEITKDIDDSTRDFIIKTLAQQTKGHPFAHFVAHLLGTMGYHTRVSPEGSDGGVDIVAHRDDLGFEPPIIKVQCKSSEGKVGDPEVSALYGKVGDDEHALFITLGYYSPQARADARARTHLRLIDGNELVDLVLAHYEKFDTKHKTLLPLRRVYVPDVAEEEDE
jgi:restriction system protein